MVNNNMYGEDINLLLIMKKIIVIMAGVILYGAAVAVPPHSVPQIVITHTNQ